MPVDVHLKNRLEELDKIYGGDEMFRIFGPTALSWCTTDSSRMYMFTSHIKQALTLINPDVPHLATGYENSIGRKNHAYKRLDGEWEVKWVIPKFKFEKKETETDEEFAQRAIQNQIIMVVFYNKKEDLYEMIERPIAENLTEKFGFLYNTEEFSKLQVGDKLKDAVIYKSTAYDEDMNYRYGKNARVFYSTSTDTIEDAVIIRKGWADDVKSVEVDMIEVSVNNNHVMLNLYGDDNEYKAFPDIGEPVKDSLICATRQINKNNLLYDFQSDHLRSLMDTDTDYYTTKNSVLYDINIYYNGDEPFPQNLFHQQMYKYYQMCQEYGTAVWDVCKIIKDSGSNYTDNVSYYKFKYNHFADPEYEWVNKDRHFNHIFIEFKVKSIIGLELGSKVTGRYGHR